MRRGAFRAFVFKRLTAAALAAAVSFAPPAIAAGAAASEERIVLPASSVQHPGGIIDAYAKAAEPELLAATRAILDQPVDDPIRAVTRTKMIDPAIARAVDRADIDELTAALARNLEAVLLHPQRMHAAQYLFERYRRLAPAYGATTVDFALPGRVPLAVPALSGGFVATLAIGAIRAELDSRPAAPIALPATGALLTHAACAIAPGPVDIAQDGHVFEVTREGTMVFFGTLGERTAHAIVPRATHGRIAEDGQRVTFAVPETPSLHLAATIGGGLDFESEDDDERCRLSLAFPRQP